MTERTTDKKCPRCKVTLPASAVVQDCEAEDDCPMKFAPSATLPRSMRVQKMCKLHENIPYKLTVGWSPPMEEYCPICEEAEAHRREEGQT